MDSTQDLTGEIIDTTCRIEAKARDLYALFADRCEDPGMAQFWLDFSREEGSHLDFWNTLLEMGKSTPFSMLIDDPADLLEMLQKTLFSAESSYREMKADDRGSIPVQDSLLLAYRLELHMLDSRFQTLFQSLRFVQEDFHPREEYREHIQKFSDGLKKYGSGYAEIELLSITLSRLWKENLRLAGLALKDGLTQVLNRRGFMTMASQISALMRRKGACIGVIMVDLDRFKALNDKRGHGEGDRALVRTAEVLTGLLRSSDIIGRYGGDEFIVLLPDTENTGEVCEKMMQTLTGELVEHFGISASAGWAQGTVKCDDISLCLNELISRADDMMYSQKAKNTED